jgi:nucleotide-binding universal stress UspA family protein
MATSAKRPLSSSVFGSVTRDVLRRSQVPVLLIGPSVPQDHVATLSSLVIGVDREAMSASTVPAVASWQETFGGQPHLVHVIGPFDDDKPARRTLDEVAAGLAAHHVQPATHIIVADDPVVGLDDVAADLDGPVYVAVSARYTDGRLHWHSTTQRLVAHARFPTLVVPARALSAPGLPHPAPAGSEDHRAFHDQTTPLPLGAASATGGWR